MGLAHSRGTEHKQGIVGLHLRVFGNSLTYAHSELVAHAAAIVLESISRIELRVNVLQPVVLCKGVGNARFADVEFLLEPGARVVLILLHSAGVVAAHYIIFIGEPYVFAKDLLQGGRKDGDISSLDLLDKELRGHSKRHTVVFLVKVNGNNGCKPNIELFGRQVSLDDVKAAVPLLCNVKHF